MLSAEPSASPLSYKTLTKRKPTGITYKTGSFLAKLWNVYFNSPAEFGVSGYEVKFLDGEVISDPFLKDFAVTK